MRCWNCCSRVLRAGSAVRVFCVCIMPACALPGPLVAPGAFGVNVSLRPPWGVCKGLHTCRFCFVWGGSLLSENALCSGGVLDAVAGPARCALNINTRISCQLSLPQIQCSLRSLQCGGGRAKLLRCMSVWNSHTDFLRRLSPLTVPTCRRMLAQTALSLPQLSVAADVLGPITS